MGQACMSKGGVPVQPYFVLGGFPGKEYGEAQAAVMTILGKLAMLCCYFELGFLKSNQIRGVSYKIKTYYGIILIWASSNLIGVWEDVLYLIFDLVVQHCKQPKF